MEHKTDYNDNIFLLSQKLKLIEDSLKLNIDTDFFIRNIKDELFFIADGIERYFKSLIKNSILINRSECLKNLQRLIRRYIDLMYILIDQEEQFAEFFNDIKSKLNEYISNFNDFEDQIRAIMTDFSLKTQDEQLIISENEYKILFSNEEE